MLAHSPGAMHKENGFAGSPALCYEAVMAISPSTISLQPGLPCAPTILYLVFSEKDLLHAPLLRTVDC